MMTDPHDKHIETDGYDGNHSIWRALWHWISYQWGWKLLCLFLAVCLWGMIISQDTTLTRERTISGVPVSVVNSAALQRNGLIVVDGLEELEPLTIKAEVPVRYYHTVGTSSFTVRLDLSLITKPGVQRVPLSSTASTYGTVTDLSSEEVVLTVEEYITRSRIPVRIRMLGPVPEGYYANAATSEVNEVTVAGPSSVVSQIARCVVMYSPPTLRDGKGTEYTASPFVFYNGSDEELDMSRLTVTSEGWGIDSITVQQTFYPMTTLEISTVGLVRGVPAEGFEIKNVTISPQRVSVADMDIESHTDDFAYLNGYVDVTGLQSSITQVVPVSRPSAFVYVSTDVIYVTVEIGKCETEQGT